MPDLRSDTRHFLRGTQSYLFMRRESVYGETYNSNLGQWQHNIPATLVPGSVISKSQTFIQPDTLTGSPSMVEGELGRQTVSGTYAFFLTHPYSKAGAYNSAFTNTLLAHAFSTNILATNGTATLNQDLHTAGLGFLQLITGLSATSTSTLSDDYKYAAYFSGIRVNSASITAPSQDSAVDIAVSFLGKEGEFFDRGDSITLPSVLSSFNLGSDSVSRAEPNFFPSWSTDVTLTKDGTSYNMVFSSVRLSVDNNLQPIDFLNGSKTVSGFQRGQRSITGSLTIPLYYNSSGSNTTQFLKDFFNKQNYSMVIEFNAEESGKHIRFTMPNVVFSADLTPDSINEGMVEMDIQFTAYPKKEETIVYSPSNIQVDGTTNDKRIYWQSGNTIVKSNNLLGNSGSNTLTTTNVHSTNVDINDNTGFVFTGSNGTSDEKSFSAENINIVVYKNFDSFQENIQYTIKFTVTEGESSEFYFSMNNAENLSGNYTGGFVSINKGSLIPSGSPTNVVLSATGEYIVVVEDVEDVKSFSFLSTSGDSVAVSNFQIIDPTGSPPDMVDFSFDPENTSLPFDIYYSLSTGYIRKVDSSGSNDTSFFDYSSSGSFTKILVDDTYLYFLTTDYKIYRVERSSSISTSVTPTVGLTSEKPTLMALDSTNNKIFYNQPSENKIFMADIGTIPFSSATRIETASDTIKDMVFNGGRLYWLEGNSLKYKVYNSVTNTFGNTTGVTNTSLISGNMKDISVITTSSQDTIYFVEDIYGLSSITTDDDPQFYSKIITPIGITFNENTELSISVN